MGKWVLFLAMVHKLLRSLEQPSRQLGICEVCLGTTEKPRSGPSSRGSTRRAHSPPGLPLTGMDPQEAFCSSHQDPPASCCGILSESERRWGQGHCRKSWRFARQYSERFVYTEKEVLDSIADSGLPTLQAWSSDDPTRAN